MDTSSNQPSIADLIKTVGPVKQDCPTHGRFETVGRSFKGGPVIWKMCPGCSKDSEVKRTQDLRAADLDRARKAAEAAIDAAAIPARFRDRTFESFVADTDSLAKALATVRAYADDFKRHLRTGAGLILIGPIGTGKSHLSAATLLQLAPDHLCLYMTVSQVIRAVRDTWRKDSETSEKQLIKRLGSDVDLLVLDEVGVQYGTDAERNLLFDILDRRYAEMRPTILLSNLHGDGLKEVLGERLYDRMRETQRMVTFTGESYRAKARAV